MSKPRKIDHKPSKYEKLWDTLPRTTTGTDSEATINNGQGLVNKLSQGGDIKPLDIE